MWAEGSEHFRMSYKIEKIPDIEIGFILILVEIQIIMMGFGTRGGKAILIWSN